MVLRHGLGEHPKPQERFQDLYDIDANLWPVVAEHSVRQSLFLSDLRHEKNTELHKLEVLSKVGRLVLMALKNSRTIGELLESAPLWGTLIKDIALSDNGWIALARFYRYLWMTQSKEEAKPLFREIEKQLSSGETQMNIEEYLLDKGRREGIDVGMQKGIDVGMQKGIDVGMQKGIDVGRREGIDVGQREASQRVLLSLLEQRFGPVAASVVERVKNSDVPLLERWLNRILSASSLEDVLI